MSNSELKVVKLSEITVSTTNPRKTFDEKSMAELTESVKQHGILQPILVRTKVPAGKNSNPYELVCGERRYRAAKEAKLEEIPVNIRMLSDDEAFELQIIENLERKDVHPLEEADAFKRMLDSTRYSKEDIAAKMAKPEKYIAQRLKLNDLIPAIKKEFFDGNIGVGHAVELARIPEGQQGELFKDATERYGGWGTVRETKRRIERGLNNLNKAPFDAEDKKLMPKCGSCVECPKRSGANRLLFSDIEEEDVCFDAGCYSSKVVAHMEKMINAIAVGDKTLLVGKTSYYEVPEYISNLCKSNSISILQEYNDFSTWDNGGKRKNLMYLNGSDAGRVKHVYLKSE